MALATEATLPAPRALGDLKPPIPVAEQAEELRKRRQQGRELRRQVLLDTSEDIQKFSDAVINHLEQLRSTCFRLRDAEDFLNRMTRNKLRSAGHVKVSFDNAGVIQRGLNDSHAVINMNQGWTSEAIHTASSFFFRNLFEAARRPYVLKARGTSPENRPKEQIVAGMIDDMLRVGNLRDRGRRMTKLVPAHGLHLMRYEMTRRVRFIRSPDGEWGEQPGDLEPVITNWPITDVLVTHPNKPSAAEQEGVFWLTPNATIQMLEKDEAVHLSLNDGVQDVPMLEMGRYVNLDQARKMFGAVSGVNTDGATDQTAHRGQGESTSSFKPFMLVEYEGALPMGAFVEREELRPFIAEYFGIAVGEAPDMQDEAAVEEWKYKLNKITHYRVSYLVQSGNRGASDLGQPSLTIQIEPDRHREPRNTLFVFGYSEDDTKFYRQSVHDLGRDIEDPADALRNAQILAMIRNADPTYGVNKRHLINKNIDEIRRLARTPGEFIEFAGLSVNINDAIQPFFVQIDPNTEITIRNLKSQFEFKTLVSAAAKGSPGPQKTETLGELQLNEAKSQLQLNDIVLGHAEELARMIKLIIQDMAWFMEPEEMRDYAIRTSGLEASEFDRVMPTLSYLEDEFEVRHPISAADDKTVLATLLLRLFQMGGIEMFPDVKQFAVKVLEVAGFNYGEELIQDANAILTPIQEHMQMAQGNYVTPNPAEPFADHILQHMGMLQALQAGTQIPGLEREETEMLKNLLTQHVEETFALLATVQQLQLATAGPEGAGKPSGRGLLEGSGGPSGGGGGQSNAGQVTQDSPSGPSPSPGPAPLEQDTQPADGLGLGNNVRQRAGT